MTAFVLFKAVLELQQPGGVAAPEQRTAQPGIDLPMARTPAGAIHVPATSVAGSFRDHLADHPQLVALLGPAPDSDTPASSALRFLGTHVTATGSRSRGRTAIERERAAAAAPTLRSSEVLDPGSRIELFLQLDDPSLRDDVTAALHTWQPYIGGGRSTGRGRAALTTLRERTLDLAMPGDRRTWLTTRGPDLFDDQNTSAIDLPEPAEPEPFLQARWRIADGLHIGTGRPDDTVEEQITEVVYDHRRRPVIPGTTWKGVLRARCEFILRSLDVPACAPSHSEQTHPCSKCLICTTFGWSAPSDGNAGLAGTLAFNDSPIHDAEIVDRTHTALDRVTAAPHDRRLFTQRVVQSGHLELRISPLSEPRFRDAIYALLVLACHDLHHGYIGVGGSTTRGLGTLQLDGEATEHTEQRRTAALRTLHHWLPELRPRPQGTR